MNNYYDILKEKYDIDKKVIDFVNSCQDQLKDNFSEFSDIAMYNQVKILKSMQEAKLQATDFNWTTGYGYGDIGRDKVEEIYSKIFKCQDALVRPNIVNGTHAITLAISSIVSKGDHLLSLTGKPYDTLLKVIGINGNNKRSLINMGVEYSHIPLIDGKIDLDSFKDYVKDNTKLVMIQRSTGYSDRRAFTIEEIEQAVKKN